MPRAVFRAESRFCSAQAVFRVSIRGWSKRGTSKKKERHTEGSLGTSETMEVIGMGKSDSERACLNKQILFLQRGVGRRRLFGGPLIILIMQSN